MTDQIRGSFTSQYEEADKVSKEIQQLAETLVETPIGSSEERDASNKLRQAYIDAGTNPRLREENADAIRVARSSSEKTIEGAVIKDNARAASDNSVDGCSAYALLHGKMTYDYFAKPKDTPLVWPRCKQDELTSMEITVPYHYQGPNQGRTIKIEN